jgi:hypothetical protein
MNEARPQHGRHSMTHLMVWAHQDLNLGPAGYEPAALNQAELWALANTLGKKAATKDTINFIGVN